MNPKNRLSLLVQLLAAFFSGFILQFISPPVYLHYLHWFSYVPLFLALKPDAKATKFNFLLGYFCGFIGIFFLFSWIIGTITAFSNLPHFLAILIMILFAAFWGLPYGILCALIHPLKERFGELWIFIFPAFWVSIEFLTPALFPYYQGVSQYRVPYTWQLASVFGAYGLTYLILLTNSALANLFFNWREKKPLPLALLILVFCIWSLNLGFGYWRFQKIEANLVKAPSAKVGLIQHALTITEVKTHTRQELLDLWFIRSLALVGQKMDLLIWPESSVLLNPQQINIKKTLSELTQSGDFSLLFGGPHRLHDPMDHKKITSWNSDYLFTNQGQLQARYDKMVLLPFGEYLPWPIKILEDQISGPGRLTPGDHVTRFQIPAFSFTTPICYEAILETQIRKMLDADIFINITNDSWFGNTPALYQHAMLSAVNATEFGRPLIRSAATGISMVVEPHGNISYETTPFVDSAQVVLVRLAKFETIYETWGRFFPYVCLLISLMALGKFSLQKS